MDQATMIDGIQMEGRNFFKMRLEGISESMYCEVSSFCSRKCESAHGGEEGSDSNLGECQHWSSQLLNQLTL